MPCDPNANGTPLVACCSPAKCPFTGFIAASVGGWGVPRHIQVSDDYNAGDFASVLSFFEGYDLSQLPESPIPIMGVFGSGEIVPGRGGSILYELDTGASDGSVSGAPGTCVRLPSVAEVGSMFCVSSGGVAYHTGKVRLWFSKPVTVVRRDYTDSVIATSPIDIGGGNPVRTNADVVIQSEVTLTNVEDITIGLPEIPPAPTEKQFGRFIRLTMPSQ